MSKVIGIDASRALRNIRTGTENYSREIIEAILALKPKYRFRLFAPYQPKSSPFNEYPNVEWQIINRKKLWSQVGLAQALNANPPAVTFIPSHVVPIFTKAPTVVTIHDLAYKIVPDSYSFLQRRYLNFATSASAAKAKKVIVPSEATKNDLISYYHLPPKKIVVIPHAFNRDVFDANRQYEAPPITGSYILFVGRLEEKKNVRLLIDAFELLCKENSDIKLVLAGSTGHGYDRIKERLEQLSRSVAQRITLPGYLPEYDMVRYLAHAAIFAFPSWYEGFGLPALEAMAMGVPVVCSNTSSLPEVADSATVMLPPNSPLSWASAFSRILHQSKFAQELKTKGLRQAERFSWDKAAKATLEVLINVAGD